MRLSSIGELNSLLEGLGILGFLVPFKNYRTELDNAGMTKHIHMYECKIMIRNEKVLLSFSGKDKVRTFTFERR